MRAQVWGPIENSYRVDWSEIYGLKDTETMRLVPLGRFLAGMLPCAGFSSLNSNEFLLDFASNSRLRCAHVDVNFRANTKFRKVHARFDGETSAGDHPALVVRFEVIHIGARAMHLFADGVAGTMDEIIPESLILNIGPGGVINLESVKNFAASDRSLHALDGAIAGIAHYLKDILQGGRRACAAKPGPGDVVEHGGRPIQLGPHIDEHGVALADGAAAFRRGLVMRIRHVRIDRDDRAVIGEQAGFFETGADEAVHVPLGDILLGGQVGCDLAKRLCTDAIDSPAGFQVHLELLGAPAGFEQLNQIG